jgi:hypothetical protein
MALSRHFPFTISHVMTGFERFLNYHASGLVDAVPKQTDKVQ